MLPRHPLYLTPMQIAKEATCSLATVTKHARQGLLTTSRPDLRGHLIRRDVRTELFILLWQRREIPARIRALIERSSGLTTKHPLPKPMKRRGPQAA